VDPGSGGFRLPLPLTERVWPTRSGKAEFIPLQALSEGPDSEASDVLMLTTIRSHDQYNTTTCRLDDRYRGVFGRPEVIFMNEEDLAALDIEHGDVMTVEAALSLARPLRLQGLQQ
jgi:anaerobic selenocysteine-containing dehydrogenase